MGHSSGCFYCGVNEWTACRHRPASDRPQMLAEPPPDEPKKTDLRPFSLPGRAFTGKRKRSPFAGKSFGPKPPLRPL